MRSGLSNRFQLNNGQLAISLHAAKENMKVIMASLQNPHTPYEDIKGIVEQAEALDDMIKALEDKWHGGR